MEKGWGKLQKYITLLFTSKAADDITTEELTMFPGMEDLISLLRASIIINKTHMTLLSLIAPNRRNISNAQLSRHARLVDGKTLSY